MGWLYMTSLGGHKTPRAYLDNQFTHPTGLTKHSVLKSALCCMQTHYAAVEAVSTEGNRSVHAVVCPVRHNPRDKEGRIFGYRDTVVSLRIVGVNEKTGA